MSEATFTYKLTAALRQELPHAVIFKHADAFTKGMPDISLTHLHQTTWFEVKLMSNRRTFEPIQLQTLLYLGRGAYIIWDPESKMGRAFWAKDKDEEKHQWHRFQELVQLIILMSTEEM